MIYTFVYLMQKSLYDTAR